MRSARSALWHAFAAGINGGGRDAGAEGRVKPRERPLTGAEYVGRVISPEAVMGGGSGAWDKLRCGWPRGCWL